MQKRLKRELGVLDATMLGLGSIVGTGVFVSIGIAAGISGSSVVIAIVLAGMVATCNALSSAQLAANHPVSGGTYEYGYRYLNPVAGFTAGWMFLCAKSASAATAALGFAGYVLAAFHQDAGWTVEIAFVTTILVTIIVLLGIQRSAQVNTAIVLVTLLSLAAFVAIGFSKVSTANLRIHFEPLNLLQSSALMFVAFTGYGRIATLGEEVKSPRSTIPKAIVITLAMSMLIYILVAIVAVGVVGGDKFANMTSTRTAPLETIAQQFPFSIHNVVSVGAVTAMLGVLLNLVLGLSRVLFAMGRRGDMPNVTTHLNSSVVIIGGVVALLTLLGDVKTAWSLSAFTVLIYYAITNLAALQLSTDERLYPRLISWIGLFACLGLAFTIELKIMAIGIGIILIGLTRFLIRR